MMIQLESTLDIQDMPTSGLKELMREIQIELIRRKVCQKVAKNAERRLDDRSNSYDCWIMPEAAKFFMAVGLRTYGDVYNLAPEDFVKIQGMKLTTINHVLCILKETGLDYEEHWHLSKKELQDMLRAQWKKTKDVKENGAA